jgi:hypothetical protein
MVSFALGALVVALLIGAWIWHVEHERQRTADLKAIAQGLGFAFAEEEDTLRLGHEAFDLFKQGRHRSAFNHMHGELGGKQVEAFDYRYVVGTGRTRRTRKHTVVMVRGQDMQLPSLQLCPENIMHKLGSLFGYQDIDLPHHPEFSRRYLLRGPDEVAIRRCFTPALVDYFERRPGIYLEASGAALLCYSDNRRLDVAAVRTELLETLQLARLFIA